MPDPIYGLCPATGLRLLDGADPSLAALAAGSPPAATEAFAYAVDGRGRISVAKAAGVAPAAGPAVELSLDDGSALRCHPAQPLLLRDGSWKPAADLTIDDSLFAAYFDTAKLASNTSDYLRVLQPMTGKYEFVHRLADEYNVRHGLAAAVDGSFVRHHINFNRFDNRPSNIARMSWSEHQRIHAEHVALLWQDDAFRTAQREGVQQYYSSHPEVIEERRERMRQQNQDSAHQERIKAAWADYRVNPLRQARYKSAVRRHYANNPAALEAKKQHMLEMNNDPDFRAAQQAAVQRYRQEHPEAVEADRQRVLGWNRDRDLIRRRAIQVSRALRERFKNDPELALEMAERARQQHRQDPTLARRAALKLWENPEMRELHREKIQRQWEDPAFRAAHLEGRKREYAERLERNPNAMAELTEKAAAALTEKWQNPGYKRQVMRSKIAGYVARLLAEFGRAQVTPALYDQQRSANWIPKSAKLGAYFDSFDELLDAAATHNHRVVAVRWLDGQVPLCAITLHEFGACVLANGIVVACPTHPA